MDAATIWNLEPVQWMLANDNEQIKKEVEALVNVKAMTDGFLGYSRAVAGLLAQAKKNDQDRGLFDDLQAVTKSVQAHGLGFRARYWFLAHLPTFPWQWQAARADVSNVVSVLVVTQMLEGSKGDDAKVQLEKARKVGTFLSQCLGVSARDLPEPLQQRFQVHGSQNLDWVDLQPLHLQAKVRCSLA